MEYLGETLDIHAGGIDHIPVHHENEIAQSEAATGKEFVRVWFHNAHLMVEGEKMSKSTGNIFTLDDLLKKGIEPLALRYLFFQTHYRQQMNFTWEASRAAQQAYSRLKELVLELRKNTNRQFLSEEKLAQVDEYRQQFLSALTNDMQIPQAVAVMWQMLKSNIPSEDKLDLLLELDQILGLKLSEVFEEVIPQEIIDLAIQRQQARDKKNFEKSDELKKIIQNKGYDIEDNQAGYKIKKTS
jgi:cysteinyl-tRNA synthetase